MGLVRLYTEEEIDYLWLAIEDKESNYEDVAALLGRTVCGVKGKVWKLTNGTNKGGLVRRPWTPDEIEKLRQLYPILPMEAVCERLKRTKSAIKTQVVRLGIRKHGMIYRDKDEIRHLAEQGFSYREIAELTGGTAKNLRNYVYKHGIKVQPEKRSGKHPWRVDADRIFAMKKRWKKDHMEESND
ncbi:TPA: hypothetical protein ACGO63_000834 [Streptococcus suis]